MERKNYSIELTREQLENDEVMEAFQNLMDITAEAHQREVISLSKDLGVSESCANNIIYLRSRSRWTQELEDELILLHREGTSVNIFEFGHKKEKP